MASKSSTLLRRWKNLLAWLEGHGFQGQNLSLECRELTHIAGKGLFACSACGPGTLLLLIPPKALMNKMTLKRHYPFDTRVVKALTAVQLISMHLFIWRPKSEEDSADPSFGPYISILPRDFCGHPLTCLVLSKLNNADDLRMSLLNSLPPSVLATLHNMYGRFWEDWNKVQAFLKKTPSIAAMVKEPSESLEAHTKVMDFLWAWLNVNTRCIYYRLKHTRADPDNLTMCPILDFANHTSGQANMVPVPSDSEVWNASPVNLIGDGLRFISADNVKIAENDEILLTYGLHPNKTLFVEYGFVNIFCEGRPSSGEVDVQDLVEKFVFTDARFGDALRVALIAEGYWGDWTFDLTPNSAQPSWRLIIALRLYHFVVATGSADEDTIEMWRDVVTGKQSQISSENELSWRKTVALLCDVLVERAENAIALGFVQIQNKEDAWARRMSGDIQLLWKEELFVARSVKESMLRGDEF